MSLFGAGASSLGGWFASSNADGDDKPYVVRLKRKGNARVLRDVCARGCGTFDGGRERAVEGGGISDGPISARGRVSERVRALD